MSLVKHRLVFFGRLVCGLRVVPSFGERQMSEQNTNEKSKADQTVEGKYIILSNISKGFAFLYQGVTTRTRETRRTRDARGAPTRFCAPRESRVPEFRATRVFRPLSYFSPKLETTRSLVETG